MDEVHLIICSFWSESTWHYRGETAVSSVQSLNVAAHVPLTKLGIESSGDVCLVSDEEAVSVFDYFGKMILEEPGHVDTTQLRRNTRSNRYDGFHVPQLSDIKKGVSKVKPRKTPVITRNLYAMAPSGIFAVLDVRPESVPDPTPILVIQEIGIVRCGVPPEELNAEKLMAAPQAAPPPTDTAN